MVRPGSDDEVGILTRAVMYLPLTRITSFLHGFGFDVPTYMYPGQVGEV
jgi:hypothetical protein